MFTFIDKRLNGITMYRLILYYLMGLLVCAMTLGQLGIIPYNPLAIVLSTVFITFVSWATNAIFSRVYNAPVNVESVYITALILVFLITPLKSFTDVAYFTLAGWASVWAMASKYILAINKKHIFNPAAIAVVITAFILGQSASWWVATSWMVVPVLIGGFLMTRKLLRTDLVLSFFGAALLTVILTHLSTVNSILPTIEKFLLSSPVLFFAFVMLTEPLTSPHARKFRIAFGIIVGFLFAPAIHIGSLYSTPELALILGNIFAYIVSPKERIAFTVKQIIKIGNDTYDFILTPDRPFTFIPGQYLEWTLGHKNPDNRGNRRYFTIASSPTESDVRIGLKYYSNMSSFKQNLILLKPGAIIAGGQRAGDFVLPEDKNKKLVCIAGGIGITPFRSMLKFLVDTNQKRDITLLYSNKTLSDIVYTDVFDEAQTKLGIKTMYTLTDETLIPQTWQGERGIIDRAMIIRNVPDYQDRIFYLSGPHGMVSAFESMLTNMGVKKSAIKTDFFPGFV